MRAALRYEAGDDRVEKVAGPPVRETAAAPVSTTTVRGREAADGDQATNGRRMPRDAWAAVGRQSVIRVVGTFACVGGSTSAAAPALTGPVLARGW